MSDCKHDLLARDSISGKHACSACGVKFDLRLDRPSGSSDPNEPRSQKQADFIKMLLKKHDMTISEALEGLEAYGCSEPFPEPGETLTKRFASKLIDWMVNDCPAGGDNDATPF